MASLENTQPAGEDSASCNESNGNDAEVKVGGADDGAKKDGADASDEQTQKNSPVTDWADTNNSLMWLNETSKEYSFSEFFQPGGEHGSDFVGSLKIDGRDFTGKGSSKKGAKRDAAEHAIYVLYHERRLPRRQMLRMHRVFGPPISTVPPLPPKVSRFRVAPVMPVQPAAVKRPDWATDDFGDLEEGGSVAVKMESATNTPPKKRRKSSSLQNLAAPLALFNERHPGASSFTEAEQTGPAHAPSFSLFLEIDGKRFDGIGGSKKAAKNAAAAKALLELDGIDCMKGASGAGPQESPAGMSSQSLHCHSRQLADEIQRLSLEKFAQLRQNVPKAAEQFKVLACVVMEIGADTDSSKLEVVSLATGTKCIDGDKVCLSGTVVNDCHAEVLARRALVRFLYKQLEMCLNGDKDSIFAETTVDGVRQHSLKPGVAFHLYISTAPCGDARVFLSGDEANSDQSDYHSLRASRGILRCKIEAGEGTVRPDAAVQTVDGVKGGDRLKTMSCSDKLARWSVLGVQGALFTCLIPSPIYYQTLTLGDLYSYDHLYRATHQRLSGIALEESHFSSNCPKLNVTTRPPPELAPRATDFSVNWTVGDDLPEVLDATAGKRLDSSQSQLCKSKLFAAFNGLYSLYRHKMPQGKKEEEVLPNNYSQAKEKAVDYQNAKKLLVECFAKNGYGNWVGKPVEQDQFSLAV